MNPLNLPQLTQYVNDFSGALQTEERKKLNELFAQYEKQTTDQVVVVLIPHRDGNELFDIAEKIFSENGIGQKGRNNGLLLIIATEEKKIRIMTGKGMEIEYSEMRSREIIEKHLRPLLNNENYPLLISTFHQIVSGGITLAPIYSGPFGMPTIMSNIIGTILTIFSLIFADGIIGGMIILGISILIIYFGIYKKSDQASRLSKYTTLWVMLLCCIGIAGIFFPGKCTLTSESIYGGKNYACERAFPWGNFSYTKSYGGQMHSSGRSSSDSDYGDSSTSSDSDWDSGGSSFDGGGGSSNGGGYGD